MRKLISKQKKLWKIAEKTAKRYIFVPNNNNISVNGTWANILGLIFWVGNWCRPFHVIYYTENIYKLISADKVAGESSKAKIIRNILCKFYLTY